MLNISKELLESLNNKGINYVYFKSTGHMDDALSGKTDFDFLVSRRDQNMFEKCLLDLNCKRFRPQKGNVYPGVSEWLGFDESTGKLIHLHVHNQLVTGLKGYKQYVLPWEEQIMSNCVLDDETGMRITHPALELIELYVRAVAKGECSKKGILTDGMNREACHLRQKTSEEEVRAFIKQCFSSDNAPEARIFFQEQLSRKEIKEVKTKFKMFLKKNRRSRTCFVKIRSCFFDKKRKVIRRLKRYCFCKDFFLMKEPEQGGCMIAFLGADGAGKSTVSTEIQRWLSWKLEVSSKSLGIGRRKKQLKYRILMKVKKCVYTVLCRGKNKGSTGKERKKDVDIPVKRTFRNFIRQRSLVKFSAEIHKEIRSLQAYRLSGGIVILDRYPQLQFKGISDGLKVNAAYSKLQKKEYNNLKICEEIEPDIVFKLNVPLDVAQMRRPADNPDNLKEKIEIVKSLKFKKAKVIEVDATQDYNAELIQIKRAIWDFI